MPFALLAEFVSEKRYLAILTIYLLSHLVNHNGGGGGLGRLLPLCRIDKALDVGGVDVIFPVVKRCFEFPGLIQRRIVVSDLPRYWQAAFSVIRLPRIGRCLSDG